MRQRRLAAAQPRGTGPEGPAPRAAEVAEHLADRAVLPVARRRGRRWRRASRTTCRRARWFSPRSPAAGPAVPVDVQSLAAPTARSARWTSAMSARAACVSRRSGLGCNNFGQRLDLEATRRVVHRALDVGITLFDTADVYGNRGGSETQLGEILGARRADVVLATKFGWKMDDAGRKRGGSRRYVMRAVEDSLRRLRTDYIDLYQIHTPDPDRPSRRRCARSTTSCGRARFATSAARTSPAGRWPTPTGRRAPRARAVRLRAERVQPARRATSSASSCRRLRHLRAGPAALLSARQRPAHGQVSPRRGRSPPGARLDRHEAIGRPLPHRAQLRVVGKLERSRSARPPAARPRHRLARGATVRRERHRRRHHTRADRRQRGGRHASARRRGRSPTSNASPRRPPAP